MIHLIFYKVTFIRRALLTLTNLIRFISSTYHLMFNKVAVMIDNISTLITGVKSFTLMYPLLSYKSDI